MRNGGDAFLLGYIPIGIIIISIVYFIFAKALFNSENDTNTPIKVAIWFNVITGIIAFIIMIGEVIAIISHQDLLGIAIIAAFIGVVYGVELILSLLLFLFGKSKLS